MGVVNSGVFFVFERFPDCKDRVRRLYTSNTSFQILCEDFRRCSEALQYWNQSMKTDAPARREEYRALQSELAWEIVRFLNETDK